MAAFVTSDILSFHLGLNWSLCLVSLDCWSLLNEKMTDSPVFTSSWMKPTLKDLKTISHQWLNVVQCEANGDHSVLWMKPETCCLLITTAEEKNRLVNSCSNCQSALSNDLCTFHVSFVLNYILCTTMCTICLQYVILSPIMQLRNHMQSLQSGIEYHVPPKLTLHLYTMYILFLPSYWRYVVLLCIFMCCTLLCNM